MVRGLLPLGLLLLAACQGVVSDEAARALQDRGVGVTLCVYPIQIHQGDQFIEAGDETQTLVAELRALDFAEVRRAGGPAPVIRTAWRRNEASMFRESADALAAHVVAHPPDADYVLYAEYLLSPDGARVMAVHWMVADAHGRIAAAGILNSHHELFRRLSPVGQEGCTRLLLAALRDRLPRRVG